MTKRGIRLMDEGMTKVSCQRDKIPLLLERPFSLNNRRAAKNVRRAAHGKRPLSSGLRGRLSMRRELSLTVLWGGIAAKPVADSAHSKGLE